MKKTNLISRFFVVALVGCFSILLFSCGEKDLASVSADKVIQQSQEPVTELVDKQTPPLFQVSIMEFNVENLFDNVDDPGREDETYLAKKTKDGNFAIWSKCIVMENEFYKKECLELDWNNSVIDAKMTNVAGTILSVNEGKGADVLLLEEVENINILSQLNKKHLGKAGYVTQVLVEGFDTRGIDVAVLSRLPLRGTPQLHRIPFVGQTPVDQAQMNISRGILEVPLLLPDGSALTVFALHFPSQSNPRYWREQAVMYLAHLLTHHSYEYVIAGGDFNITNKEENETGWYKSILGKVGLVSHLMVEDRCDNQASAPVPQICRGSYFYKGGWDHLDALIFGGQFKSPYTHWKVDTSTINVLQSNPAHLTAQSTPRRFDPVLKTGVSDHFPIYSEIKFSLEH